MQRPLYFVSGLPRSGSTLLINVLGQNPDHYVTPTSGLINLFVAAKTQWTSYIEFQAEGLEKVKPRVLRALRGMLQAYFEEELSAGKAVFDKSRGWLQHIEPLEEALGRPIKLLVPVRDVRAIVSSFEKLYRKRSIDYQEADGDACFQCQTVEGRAELLLSPAGVVGLSIARLRDALQRGVADRLILVPYPALTQYPQEVLSALHGGLGLEPHEYDTENVEQITHENDVHHGLDLHEIRPKIEPPRAHPWQDILPAELAEAIAQQYMDINQLAGPMPMSTAPVAPQNTGAPPQNPGDTEEPAAAETESPGEVEA